MIMALPTEKFLSIVLPRNTIIMLQQVLHYPMSALTVICQVVAYGG